MCGFPTAQRFGAFRPSIVQGSAVVWVWERPFLCKPVRWKASLFLKAGAQQMPLGISMYLWLACHWQSCAWKRALHVDVVKPCPFVCVFGSYRLTVPPPSPSCSGWSSCACVLSSMWKRILLTFRYVGFVFVSVHIMCLHVHTRPRMEEVGWNTHLHQLMGTM